ncbi:MAG: penicillin-binding protein 2 [bacterium]
MKNYLKNKKISVKGKAEIEPQEVLLDSLAKKREDEWGVSEKKFEIPISSKSIWVFYTFFVFLMGIFFLRSIKLQILDGDKFAALAEDNKTYDYPLRTTRGVVYDSFGRQLVFNETSFDLVFDKKNQDINEKEIEDSLQQAAKIISVDFSILKEKIEQAAANQVVILENISHEILLAFEVEISFGNLPGFVIEKNAVRNYDDGVSFSHVIGYTGRINSAEYQSLSGYFPTDYVGKSGIEKSYETILRGEPGVLRIEKDAFGNKQAETTIADPKSGKSLILWLDGELQKKSEEELRKILDKTGSPKGVVVAMNPKTGGILAMVSLPSFDNNLFSKNSDPAVVNELLNNQLQPLFNRAIAGTYHSGSTIKPLIASAALEEKIISPNKRIDDSLGYLSVANPWDPEKPSRFNDWTAHGLVTLRQAIAVSCNVYFYTIGGGYGSQEGLGVSRIKKYLGLFGWGHKTKIDLPGEREGLIPDPSWKKEYFKDSAEEIWRDGDTYNLSIGQGYLLVTPIQVVTAFSAIANGGKLLEPQIVKTIISGLFSEPQDVINMEPEIIREDFIDSNNLEIVREGMREAVLYGSSVTLNSLSVEAAAKTGTAETSKKNYYHNWVTVFAPYDDPQIVLTVLIEDVKEVQVAALPVAKAILEWYFVQ